AAAAGRPAGGVQRDAGRAGPTPGRRAIGSLPRIRADSVCPRQLRLLLRADLPAPGRGADVSPPAGRLRAGAGADGAAAAERSLRGRTAAVGFEIAGLRTLVADRCARQRGAAPREPI